MYVVRHLMGMIIMLVLLILYLMEIILFPVQGIRPLNCGKLVLGLIRERITGIKSGWEMLLCPVIIKPWLLALTIKVYVSGKSINKLQSIVFLHMIMSLKLSCSLKVNKVNNWWNLNSLSQSSHKSQK